MKSRIEYAGGWAMRGPQNRLHFYRTFQGALSTKAVCGAEDLSFAYGQDETPTAERCCGRCWRIRGARP